MTTATESPRNARLDLRMPSDVRALISEAAALSGTSLTDYVLSVIVPVARRDVIESKTLRLSKAAWDDFLEMLDKPDSEALAALRAHVPAWGESL